jgi:hypothetical protein
VFDPLHRIYNGRELEHLGSDFAHDQLNAELGQYRNQENQIKGTEQTVSSRYGQAGKITEGALAGLQTGAEAGAKTYENQQAESALKAGQEVNTSGQNAVTRNGGYLDPQVQAALNAEGSRAAGIGGAQNTLASSLGANETNYMTNIRAAAAQRIQEGQRDIGTVYGKQLGTVRGKEAEATAKTVPNALKFGNEIGQKQFQDQMTARGLGIKTEALGVKAAEGQAKNRITERGQNLNRQTNVERNALARQKALFDRRAKKEDIAIKGLSAKDKARYDAARIRIDQGKGANPAAGRKYMSELSRALGYAQALHGSKTKEGKPYTLAQIRAGVSAKFGADVTTGALNLAYYNRLSKADQAVAIANGMSPEMRPEWFR